MKNGNKRETRVAAEGFQSLLVEGQEMEPKTNIFHILEVIQLVLGGLE